jgi:FHA domain
MWLRVVTGEGAGRLVEITGPRYVVGSDPSCDLVLQGRGVSPRHAAFEEQVGGRFTLVDLDSARGTFVSTRRIRGPVWVYGIEEVCFGDAFAELYPTRAATRSKRPRSRRRRVLLAGALVALAVAGGVTALLTLGGGDDTPSAVTEVAPTTSEEDLPFAGGSEPATTSDPATTDEPSTGEEPPTEEPPGEETDILFADDFSDPSSGWEVFDDEGGSASYANGGLVIRVKRSSYFATSDSGWRLENGVVTVEATHRPGVTSSGFGIVCRYRNQRNFDLLAAAANGTAAILRSENGRLTVLTGAGRWVRSDSVPVGARRYVLQAECRTDRLRLWVNGRRILSVASPGAPGSVGLFAVGIGSVRFDDVLVRKG